jgi:predicted dehydrogenase
MSGAAELRADVRPLPPAPLAVAGAGSIGRRHLRNLRALGVGPLVVLRSGAGSAARTGLREEHDLAGVLGQHPRAVLVCNPTSLHVPTALAAARAGAHLFLEKPVSHDLEGVALLEAEVRARDLVVLVGFQYRFHPGLRRIREWIEGGELGAVVSARATWGEHLPSWHPGEDYRKSYSARHDLGGGALATLSHPFDYLRWLLGEVTAVSAEVTRRSDLEIDVEDTAVVLLRFASGALATVSLDYVQRPRRHELEIVGTAGTARWIDTTGAAELWAHAGGRASFTPARGFGRNTMFVDEMRHFLACVGGDEPPLCALADGVAALRIVVAARSAASEGRSVALAEVRP